LLSIANFKDCYIEQLLATTLILSQIFAIIISYFTMHVLLLQLLFQHPT